MAHRLTWDAIYEIALALIAAHPEIELEQVSLTQLYNMVVELPQFDDDLELVNENILRAIFQEWYEELD